MVSVVDQSPYTKHIATGNVAEYPFEFAVESAADLRVSVGGVVVPASAYGVTGVGRSQGGSVVFATRPPRLAVVELRRLTRLERDTDYQPNGDLPADTVDRDFRRLWQAAQEQRREIEVGFADLLDRYLALQTVVQTLQQSWTAPAAIGDPMWAAIAASLAGSTPAQPAGDLTTLAIIAAINAANRSAVGVTKNTTPPPAPSGMAASGGVTTLTVSWDAPTYTVGHGHGTTIVYGAQWTGALAPADADLQPLWYGPGRRALISIDPGSKWTLRTSFVTYDGIEGPRSAAVVAQANKIGSANAAEDLLTAKLLSNDIATGALVNDPTFASGTDGWRGFVNRLASTAVGVPAPAPSAWVARFTGRDGYSKRTVAVVAGQEFRVTCYCNPLNSGARVGVQIVTQAGAFISSLATLAPNAWGRVTLDYTVPVGVTEIAVGPMIDQPDGGTLIAMFAHIELVRRMPYDLIVQGDVIADQVSATTINAFQAALGRLTVDAATVTGTLTAASLVVGAVSIQRQLYFGLYTVALNIQASAHQHWSNSQVFDAPVGARLSFSVEDSFTVECGAMELAGGGGVSEPASVYVDTDVKVFVDGEFTTTIYSGLNDLLQVSSFHIGIETGDLSSIVVKGIKRTTSRTFLFTVPPDGAATSRSIQVQIQKTVSIFDASARLLRTAAFATTKARLKGLGTVQENKV